MRRSALFPVMLMALATALPMAANPSVSAPDKENERLRNRITELETLVERLRMENAALRRQPPVETKKPAAGPAPEAGGKKPDDSGFWISNTGKRHNSGCYNFGKTRGRAGSGDEGVACKICGG